MIQQTEPRRPDTAAATWCDYEAIRVGDFVYVERRLSTPRATVLGKAHPITADDGKAAPWYSGPWLYVRFIESYDRWVRVADLVGIQHNDDTDVPTVDVPAMTPSEVAHRVLELLDSGDVEHEQQAWAVCSWPGTDDDTYVIAHRSLPLPPYTGMCVGGATAFVSGYRLVLERSRAAQLHLPPADEARMAELPQGESNLQFREETARLLGLDDHDSSELVRADEDKARAYMTLIRDTGVMRDR